MKRPILILLLFGLTQLLAGLALAGLQYTAMDITPETLGIGVFAANILLIVLLYFCGFTEKKPWRGLTRPGYSAKELTALLCVLILAHGLSAVFAPLDLDDFGMGNQFEGMQDSLLCILGICIIAPVAEEMAFREGIVREMLKGGYAPWTAIATSAVLFGCVHGNPLQALPAVVLGAVLGWFYTRTGNLRLCLPAHILNNTLACIELRYPELDVWLNSQPAFLLIPVGLVLCGVGVVLIQRV